MKRFLGILLTFAMLVSCAICVSADELANLSDEQKIALEFAMDEGIIGGYPDGTIVPYGGVTRAEFITMIVRYMGYETSEYATFDDVPKTFWASKEIATGVKYGLINGMGDNLFAPQSNVKVEHAAKILTALKDFTKDVDIEKSGGWPEAYMLLAEYAEMFVGTDHYELGENLTRIDVAVLLYNVSQLEKCWFEYTADNQLCIYFERTDKTNFGYYCGLTLKEKGQISDEPLIEKFDAETDTVLEIVNEERAKKGYAALAIDATLQKAANQRAKELAENFSHERPDGTSATTVVSEFGVQCKMFGENIAMGQTSARQVMDEWLDSPAHRENILQQEYDKIGIGVYEDADGIKYWVQLFIVQ
ncbi:MAG: S-layer homology domain-containing protein [Clostridia bacterium]|nr:S-layer homology domain-containing protein [Clostridia bacterium]MBR2972981.1 S-layer homology domain-containing protein [Clostridia bacterium]